MAECNTKSTVNFQFRNIGPIKEAELELGDLTIVAGRNNTGKTYIVYTLYGFLKMWSGFPPWLITDNPEQSHQAGLPKWEDLSKQLAESGRTSVKLGEKTVGQQRQWLMPVLTRGFSEQALSNLFSSQQSAFENASIEIAYPEKMLSPPRSVKRKLTQDLSLSLDYDGEKLDVTASEIPKGFPLDILSEHLAADYAYFLLERFFPRPFILSAERFGISLFYRELDFAKNQLVDLLQKIGDDKKRESISPYFIIDRATSRYALPIKDNIDYTRNIPDIKGNKSDLEVDGLLGTVKDMMDGYYRATGEDLRFISKARGKGRSFNIPLHLASSSARGLSDLYFFLRHSARAGELLIIDEPESHLDTANQILLARLLARFVRAGLKVLITTHSDYIIKEVNNLVMLSQPFQDKAAIARRLGYDPGEWISSDSVRAYVAKDGGLTACPVESFGIDMPLFDEAIDRINKVSNELTAYASNRTSAREI